MIHYFDPGHAIFAQGYLPPKKKSKVPVNAPSAVFDAYKDAFDEIPVPSRK